MEKEKNRIYIGKEVENAILEYCNLDPDTEDAERNRIFNRIIYPALDTLVQHLIFDGMKRGKPYYCETSYEDLRLETISFLYQKLQTFDPERGKAFSFLNRTAYNYILAHSQRVYKNQNLASELSVVDDSRDLILEETLVENRTKLQIFFHQWTRQSMNNIDKMFDNDRDRRIADAILRLFENVTYLDIYNKKALMIMIKEQVSHPTMYITKILADLKLNFKLRYKEFLRQTNEE